MSMILNGSGASANRAIASIVGSAGILATPSVLTNGLAAMQPMADDATAASIDGQTGADSQPANNNAGAAPMTQDDAAAQIAQDAGSHGAGGPSPDVQHFVNEVSALLNAEGQNGNGLPVSHVLDADGTSDLGVAPILTGVEGTVSSVLGSAAGSDGSGTLPAIGSLDGITGLLGADNPLNGLLDTADLTGGLANDVHTLVSGLGLDGDGSGGILDLAGSGTLLQPIIDSTNTTVLDVHTELEVAGHELGLPFLVHGVTHLGETVGLGKIGAASFSPDGHTNLVTDAVNLPGDVLDGDLNGAITHVGADLSDVVNAASALKDTALFGIDVNTGTSIADPTNPLPELLSGIGSSLQNGPILSANGGNPENAGLLGGIVGDLSQSPSGHLVDADIGPSQSQSGLDLNLLATPDAGNHPAEVGVINVGPSGPNLADLGVLTGDSPLSIPNLGGAGADSLVGSVLGSIGGGDVSHAGALPALPDLPIVSEIASIADPGGAAAGADQGVLHLNGAALL